MNNSHDMACNFAPRMELNDNMVHLWRVFLPGLEHCPDKFKKILSTEENNYCNKLKNAAQRSRFIIRKALQRLLISKYIPSIAEQIKYSFTQFGRPIVAGGNFNENVEFNISHSGEWLLMVFSKQRLIGVDVEYLKRDFPTLVIAERFFSEVEAQAVKACAGHEEIRAFFTIWVRKEAYIKALGKGLYMPLQSFSVPTQDIVSDKEPTKQNLHFVGSVSPDSNFFDVHVDSEHVGCVVCPQKTTNITTFDLNSMDDVRECLRQ